MFLLMAAEPAFQFDRRQQLTEHHSDLLLRRPFVEPGGDDIRKSGARDRSPNFRLWLRVLKNSAVFKIEQHLEKVALFFVILIQ